MIWSSNLFMIIISIIKKYKNIILYVAFGFLATIVNLASYYLCYNIIQIQNVTSTIVAWFLGVVFAFVTNKLWVFDSKKLDTDTMKHEISLFLGARIGTGLLDVVIMYLTVDVMNWNSNIWKLVSNVIVIILNYVASKLLIFKK